MQTKFNRKSLIKGLIDLFKIKVLIKFKSLFITILKVKSVQVNGTAVESTRFIFQ